jgi:uncharacterized protein YeeX (DUF496 family)
LAGKLDILSHETGDSPWEGEAKHRQNKDRILLLEQNFGINTTDMISIEEDGELIKTIKSKMTTDSEIQDVLKKLRTSKRKDNKVVLGLCKEKNGLLT